MLEEIRAKLRFDINCYFYNFNEVWSKIENEKHYVEFIHTIKHSKIVLDSHLMNLEAFRIYCWIFTKIVVSISISSFDVAFKLVNFLSQRQS